MGEILAAKDCDLVLLKSGLRLQPIRSGLGRALAQRESMADISTTLLQNTLYIAIHLHSSAHHVERPSLDISGMTYQAKSWTLTYGRCRNTTLHSPPIGEIDRTPKKATRTIYASGREKSTSFFDNVCGEGLVNLHESGQ